MIAAEPDYKLLYEQSQKLYEQSQQNLAQTQQQLRLALLDANELRRKLFGIKSDNRVKKAVEGQLDLFPLGATQQDQQISEELAAREADDSNLEQDRQAQKRQKSAVSRPRMVLPESLEREELTLDPDGDLSDYKVIGQEVTEVLVMVPASFKAVRRAVRRIIRRKWALKDPVQSDRKGVLIAPIPSRTIKRGLFDESVLAHLLTSKFVDHLPLYRQKQIFERIGLKIPPSTLTDNTNAACKALEPIYNALRREALANLYLQVDETRLQVLENDGKKGTSHRGFLWTYHAPVDGLVFFDYQKGRDKTGPEKILRDFQGVVQTDAYTVYQSVLGKNEAIQHYYCMAHIRRKFDEAVNYDKDRATWAVDTIAQLYKIEKDIREAEPAMTESQIVEKRMREALPILTQLKEWMQQEYPRVLPGSPIGKAMAYALPLMDNMKFYTLHGELQIDNNLIENAIRPVALGRKNYLFAGTHDTAQNAAMIYSLFATCKKHEVNPQEWLLDVLRKMNDPNYEGKFSDLLPHRWRKNFS
jgi:transposase